MNNAGLRGGLCEWDASGEVRKQLTGEDLNLVNAQGLGADRVRLDDGHIVTINREREVRVARDGDKAEAVAI